ncbi:MAG: DUF5071 domain-containing protein, partial [Enterobacterales bacterium]|nr:DUF5071 domain-containing protein [Enterobacterales bacterium]
VLDVLKTQDSIWKYWVVSELVDTTDLQLAKAIAPELQHLKLKTAASVDEDDISVNSAIDAILHKLQTQRP